MENGKHSQHRNTPIRAGGNRMSTLDRARAQEGMRQAMALGNLALETWSHVRSFLRSVGQPFGRGVVPKRSFTKNSSTYFD
jgi:hypothetical protein